MPESIFDANAQLRKIRKMLDRAEDPRLSQFERELAREKAYEFSDKYNVDMAFARNRTRVTSAKVIDRMFEVGRPFQQQKQLAYQVYKSFGCDLLHVGHGRENRGSLHAFGYEEDLDLANMLFTSLVLQSGREAQSAYRDYTTNFKPWRCETDDCEGKEYRPVPMDMDWYYCTICRIEFYSRRPPTVSIERRSTWYRSFWDEFVLVVGGRLKKQQTKTRDEMRTESSGPGKEVALRNRDVAVQEQLTRYYPKVTKGRRTRVAGGSGRAAGRAAGMRADLGHERLSTRKGVEK